MGHEVRQTWLSDDEWDWVSARLPIVCVDVLPVQRDLTGRISRIGLILRDSPFGPRWSHLGGRVLHDEELHDAATRHVRATLRDVDPPAADAEPFFVHQYFQHEVDEMGLDPRKHAVAVCFTVDVPVHGDPAPVPGGEATAYRWFDPDSLPDGLWPGARPMVNRALLAGGAAEDLASYAVVSARQISHNELMWQTPALAMTAMAFLLTIALGSGEWWQRSLAAGLSALVAIISAQLLAKHSIHAVGDADILYAIEQRRRLPLVHAPPVRHEVRMRREGLQAWLASKRSRQWWYHALLGFGGVSVLLALQPLVERLVR